MTRPATSSAPPMLASCRTSTSQSHDARARHGHHGDQHDLVRRPIGLGCPTTARAQFPTSFHRPACRGAFEDVIVRPNPSICPATLGETANATANAAACRRELGVSTRGSTSDIERPFPAVPRADKISLAIRSLGVAWILVKALADDGKHCRTVRVSGGRLPCRP
jgi:hypothetical protein